MASQERKKVICLVHFNPLEMFPPAMNLVRFFEAKPEVCLKVFSTLSETLPLKFKAEGANTSITRIGWTAQSLSQLKRIVTYISFNIGVLLWLIIRRPDAILYIETISSFAPVFYKKFLNRKVKLLIHYHEYMTKEEYENGMFLVRHFHSMERTVYGMAVWVSHTNEKRMQLFKNDIGTDVEFPAYILPNFPPASWRKVYDNTGEKQRVDCSIRIVYLGNLHLEKLYIKEFSQWVASQQGSVVWDIYSLNNTAETDDFFRNLNSPFIKFKGSVDYYNLPEVLQHYDVGVILYKGRSLNWIYSVPNKLFEYHICGLDIWMSSEIETSLEYVTSSTYPQIKVVDFNCLPDAQELYDRSGMRYNLHPFVLDSVLDPLMLSIN